MNPFDNFANSTLLSLGGIFNFNSSTQSNQAGVSAKASGAKEEENKLPFKSSPAPNPLHFFNESQAKEKITNPRNSRFFIQEDEPSKAHGSKTLPAKPFSSNAKQTSPSTSNIPMEHHRKSYAEMVNKTGNQSDRAPSSTNIITSRDTSTYAGAPSNSQQQPQLKYGNSRIRNMNEEYEKEVKSTNLYLELNLNVPPPNTVIKPYRKSHIVPSGQVYEERIIEEQRVSKEKTNAQLARDAKKQGLQSPDKVYEHPGR